MSGPLTQRYHDISGQKFGKLTAISRDNKSRWYCECECGGNTTTNIANLRNGHTRSCGCLNIGAGNTTHGYTRGANKGKKYPPEYIAWNSMKNRCYKKSQQNYERYGGRGIKVCDEWLHDFPSFFSHIGTKPTPQHSLDRIDNMRNYEPGNIKWSTPKEQAANRRPRRKNIC